MTKYLTKIILYTYLGLILLPFVYLLFMSLSAEWPYPATSPDYIGFRNWHEVLAGQGSLLTSLGLSLLISLTVATISTAFGLIISEAIYEHRDRRRLEFVGYLPYVVSPVVFGACLSFYFLKTGLYGGIGGVIIAQLLIACPYTVLFFIPFWGKRTTSYRDLVQTLGGSRWEAYRRVLLPLAKDMIVICFFQTFLLSWFEYGITSVIGVGKVETLTIKVFLYLREANYYYGAVTCCLLILPPTVLLFINKRIVVKQVL